MNFTIIIPFIFSALASYLLGSISFSIIFTNLFKGTDVRQHGSGNAGATNVLRTAGKLPALFTLICDFSKAVVAINFALLIFRLYPVAHINDILIKFIAGVFCIIGHIYPLYFGFKGGKGVLTGAALVLLIDWRVFIIVLAAFIICAAISRMVSLSSLIAAVLFPIATMTLQIIDKQRTHLIVINTLFAALISLIVFYKHRANLKRIFNGTESKLGKKGKED